MEILEQIAKQIEAVEDGNESALKVYAHLKGIQGEIKSALEQIEHAVLDEADLYPDKTFQEHGFEFTVKSGGARYSYKFDDRWKELNEAVKKRQEQMQTSFKLSQKGQGMLIDDDTGEEIPAAEVSYAKSSISIKKVENG